MSERQSGLIVPPEFTQPSDTPLPFLIVDGQKGFPLSDPMEVVLRPSFGIDAENPTQINLSVPSDVETFCETIRNYGGRSLIVGGYVRDELLRTLHPAEFSSSSKDIDLELYGMDDRTVMSLLRSVFPHNEVSAVGKSFGIIKVKIAEMHEPLDVAVTRRERKVAAGSKGFEVTTDKEMDVYDAAIRRDLTINSISYDPVEQKLFDPYNGVQDIQDKIIRVTNAETFQEDPLRVLRIMQFASRFGFEVSEETIELSRQMVARGDLDTIDRERVSTEFRKLFTKGLKPSIGLEFARRIGFFTRYYPQIEALHGIGQSPVYHPEGDVWTHTLQVTDAAAEIANREIAANTVLTEDDWNDIQALPTEQLRKEKIAKDTEDWKLALVTAAFCHDFGKATHTLYDIETRKITSHGHEAASVEPAKAFLDTLMFPLHVKKQILALVPEHMNPPQLWKHAQEGTNMQRAVAALAQRLSKANVTAATLGLLSEADHRGRNGTSMRPLTIAELPETAAWIPWYTDIITRMQVRDKPTPPLLKGGEILAYIEGMKPGIWVGKVSGAVYQAQLAGEITTKEEAKALSQQIYTEFCERVATMVAEGLSEQKAWECVV